MQFLIEECIKQTAPMAPSSLASAEDFKRVCRTQNGERNSMNQSVINTTVESDRVVYTLEVFTQPTDLYGMPSEATVPVTREDAIAILSLSTLVKEQGLYCVQRFDYRTQWGESVDSDDDDTSVRTDCDLLEVTASTFRMRANLKNCEEELLTADIQLSHLAEQFGLEMPAHV